MSEKIFQSIIRVTVSQHAMRWLGAAAAVRLTCVSRRQEGRAAAAVIAVVAEVIGAVAVIIVAVAIVIAAVATAVVAVEVEIAA